MSGISILQGPHQVAQKLTRTTLPLYSASFTGRLFWSLRTKSKVALPVASQEDPACGRPDAGEDTSVSPGRDDRSIGSVSRARASAAAPAMIQRGFISPVTSGNRRWA